ncbi:hypothetical protein AwDysgo_01360 [Bacteroidales bacterium]|nr:hypothetical protein AwDysgo_01360 [Bacteroidales bacterium]
MNKLKIIVATFFAVLCFVACESSEDISNGMDHSVPIYKVLTDSLIVNELEEIEIKVEVEDEGALAKLEFFYADWNLRQLVDLRSQGAPKSYIFAVIIKIPEGAKKQWIEDVVANDGTIYKRQQSYHRLQLLATDMSQNVRTIPIYIKVN